MKALSFRSSFRRKLMLSFLAVGVIPLLVCIFLILNVFRASLSRSAEANANSQLTALSASLSEALDACGGVLDDLGRRPSVAAALSRPGERDTLTYNELYTAAAPLLRDADFSLYDAGGALRYTTGSGTAGESLPVNWGLLAGAERAGGQVVYRASSPYDNHPRGLMQLARVIHGPNGPAGYAVAELSSAHFQRLFDGKYTADSGVLLTDPYWDTVYATPGIQDAALAGRIRQRILRGESLAQLEADQTYRIQTDPASSFHLVLRQPQPMAAWVTQAFYLATAVSLLLCLALCLSVSMKMSQQLFQPIRSLNSAMAAVEEGNLDIQVEVPGTDEISQLSGRFNRMTQRLRVNLEDSLRQQQELGDAQIRMMQAQLNPHFLYNTLDTMKWLGKINQVPEVATISADLADILRSSISGGEFVELREELKLLERYVEIQSIRFPHKFEYNTQVDRELLDVLVPKLMLQPLVENAIIHGFEDGSHGHISLTAERSGEEIILTIRDDGCGMSPESMERFLTRQAPGSGHHLGLYNVDAILRLHYGPDRGLAFLPQPDGKGTCIRAILPISRREEEQP